MKLMHTKNYLPKAFLLFVILFVWSCSGSSDKKESQASETSSSEVKTTNPTLKYYINGVGNISLAEITIDGENLNIQTEETTLFGVKKREDKRKYYDQNDQFRYAVKYKEQGDFKLRDENEELLWKVKVKDDKIKIANNEEMEGAYDINLYEEGRIKLKKNESEISSIRFEPGGNSIEVQEKYYLRNFNNSFAPGVLMIPDMDETAKFIICAELANLGK